MKPANYSPIVLSFLLMFATFSQAEVPHKLERIVVESDGFMAGGLPFHPWGLNYGNNGALIEDFWKEDWSKLAADFQEMKTLGTNVVRVHLQFGKMMAAPSQSDPEAIKRLKKLLLLAEETGLYLDLTGLACYRPSDVPAWYDALEEEERWLQQAFFWSSVAKVCASSPAIFCYDLMNEPVVPGDKRGAGKWSSGQLFGGYDFLQCLTLDPKGRAREEIAAAWIRRLKSAIREHDKEHLITVGLLPWMRDWKHLSGFLPATVGPELDFISVHLYPDTKKPGEALEALGQVAIGKPIVIEETFPLTCSSKELAEFLKASRKLACGWVGHYDGEPLEELDARERQGKLTLPQAAYRDWLRLFVELKPGFAPDTAIKP